MIRVLSWTLSIGLISTLAIAGESDPELRASYEQPHRYPSGVELGARSTVKPWSRMVGSRTAAREECSCVPGGPPLLATDVENWSYRPDLGNSPPQP